MSRLEASSDRAGDVVDACVQGENSSEQDDVFVVLWAHDYCRCCTVFHALQWRLDCATTAAGVVGQIPLQSWHFT